MFTKNLLVFIIFLLIPFNSLAKELNSFEIIATSSTSITQPQIQDTELHDVDNQKDNNSSGPDVFQRGLISDIEKLKKVTEILQTIGEIIIPVITKPNPVAGSTTIQSDDDFEQIPNNFGSKGFHDGLLFIHEIKKDVDEIKNTL